MGAESNIMITENYIGKLKEKLEKIHTIHKMGQKIFSWGEYPLKGRYKNFQIHVKTTDTGVDKRFVFSDQMFQFTGQTILVLS